MHTTLLFVCLATATGAPTAASASLPRLLSEAPYSACSEPDAFACQFYDCATVEDGRCDYTCSTELRYSHCAVYFPPAPPGGYNTSLLCPPTASHIALNSYSMRRSGAVQVNQCWNISAATAFDAYVDEFDIYPEAGLFKRQSPLHAITLPMPSVTTLQGFLSSTDTFDQSVTLTGLGIVVSTYAMFGGARAFNSPVSLEGLGSTGKWTNAENMFLGAYAFNQPIDAIGDTSAVINLRYMFSSARAFNQPVTVLDTSSATSFESMFAGALSFAQELYTWDVGKGTNFINMFQSSLMADEAVSGGPGFGRACRIHHSWSKQNATWNPVTAKLVADAAELELSLCAPHLAPLEASSSSNPHLAFAHRGTADFRGCERCYFNMLSTQDLLINVRTSLATFELKGSTVHGSFLTEVHLAWHDAPAQRWLNASFWAAEVGEHNFGWRAVNLTCGSDPDERAKAMYYNTRRSCGAATLARGYSSLTVELPEWRVSVTPQLVFGHLEGPRRRLDLSLVPRVPEAELAVWLHGLIGQSFDGNGAPLSGRVDDYSVPVVHTSAMAEGAIEGTADDYRVPSAFSAAFRYSRLGALPGQTRPRDVAAITASTGAPAQGRGPVAQDRGSIPRAGVTD